MKTIKQECHNELLINSFERYYKISQDDHCIIIESANAPELVAALLPPDKAIIDVPIFEGYEFVRFGRAEYGEYNYNGEQLCGWNAPYASSGFYLIYRKLTPDFKWPEHLPDGTRVWPEGTKLPLPIGYYIGIPGQGTCNLKDYNALARPEDRIKIPEWLEKKPRTIVKGER